MDADKAAQVLAETDWPGLEPAVTGPTFAYLFAVSQAVGAENH